MFSVCTLTTPVTDENKTTSATEGSRQLQRGRLCLQATLLLGILREKRYRPPNTLSLSDCCSFSQRFNRTRAQHFKISVSPACGTANRRETHETKTHLHATACPLTISHRWVPVFMQHVNYAIFLSGIWIFVKLYPRCCFGPLLLSHVTHLLCATSGAQRQDRQADGHSSADCDPSSAPRTSSTRFEQDKSLPSSFRL